MESNLVDRFESMVDVVAEQPAIVADHCFAESLVEG
jgi:hypothetical protein